MCKFKAIERRYLNRRYEYITIVRATVLAKDVIPNYMNLYVKIHTPPWDIHLVRDEMIRIEDEIRKYYNEPVFLYLDKGR